MSDLRALQGRFVNYLRFADTAIAADVAAATSDECARRLSIYHNAYRIRLRGSIETDHPVLGIYLGDDGFEKMAAAFIHDNPSHVTSLRNFCDPLPEFLRQRPPYADIGVLAEIAKFERMLMEAFDAADAGQVDDKFITSLNAEHWPELNLLLHPSVRCYVTDWNSVEIWQAIKAERTPPDARQDEKRAWLLWRNRALLTEFRSLPIDEYSMLMSTLSGDNIAKICMAMLEWHTEGEVAARVLSLLRSWINDGLIVAEGS